MNAHSIGQRLAKTALAALAAALVSCATLPEPSASVPSLVVGQASVEVKNFDQDLGNGQTLNGTITDGIDLVITNYATKAAFKVHGDALGNFAVVLPPGNYSITSFVFAKTVTIITGNGTSRFSMNLEPSSSTKFVVKPNAVTDLGTIVWQADGKAGSQVVTKETFAALKTQFGTQYKGSGWLTQPWQNVKVTRNLDFDIDNGALAGNAPARTSAKEFRQARIDGLVRAVPAAILAKQATDPEGFVTDLVAFLIKGSPSAFETVKRLHDWECDNIAYDAPSFFSGKLPDQGYANVLKTKLAVCEGYAVLFKKLCDTAGVPCAVVDGYSRGYGASIFGPEDPTAANHAWNLVQVDHQSYLVDTTWDAGSLDGNRYTKSYGTGYLFADPAAFILSHFPSNPQYQLLSPAVSAADFVKLPSWNSEFYTAGITALSKLEKVNHLGNEFALSFRVPGGVDLLATVYDEKGHESANAVFRQQAGDVISVNVALPQPGKYVLRLFEHQASDKTEEYAGCGETGFTADAASPAQFPRVYSSFVANDKLIAPLGTPLVAGKTTDFKVVLPQATGANLVIGKQFITMNRDFATNTFTASAQIPEGTTDVGIAMSKNSNSWETVLDFPVTH